VLAQYYLYVQLLGMLLLEVSATNWLIDRTLEVAIVWMCVILCGVVYGSAEDVSVCAILVHAAH